MIAVRFLIEGRVQGVGYRAWTCQLALRLGVAGYAQNLPDGRVTVLAEGTPEAIAELSSGLQFGPKGARVDKVTNLGYVLHTNYRGFDIA